MKNIQWLSVCLIILGFNTAYASDPFKTKSWGEMAEDDTMDYSAPLIFDSSLPLKPEPKETALPVNNAPVPTISAINHHPQPPKINPFITIQKPNSSNFSQTPGKLDADPPLNGSNPKNTPILKILKKEPGSYVYTTDSNPQGNTHKRPPAPTGLDMPTIQNLTPTAVLIPTFTRLTPPQQKQGHITPKQTSTKSGNFPMFLPKAYVDTLEYFPNYQVQDLGPDLMRILEAMWQPYVVNILFIEANGPFFVTTPLWNNLNALIKMASEFEPAFQERFRRQEQKSQLLSWLQQQMQSGNLRSTVPSDKKLWDTLESSVNSFVIQPISDLAYSQRHTFLKDLRRTGIPLDKTLNAVNSEQVKNAGRAGGAFFRNLKTNQFIISMGYLINEYREKYPSIPLNIIHLHSFLEERELHILKSIYGSFQNDYGITYQSIQYSPTNDLLPEVFKEDQVLERMKNDFLGNTEPSLFANFKPSKKSYQHESEENED